VVLNRDYYPEVSHPANRVAFVTASTNENLQMTYLIWTADWDGNEITQFRRQSPRWSPDGSRLRLNTEATSGLLKRGTSLTQLTTTQKIVKGYRRFPLMDPESSMCQTRCKRHCRKQSEHLVHRYRWHRQDSGDRSPLLGFLASLD